MAGGFGSKIDPKNKSFIKNNSSEILKDSHDSSVPKTEPKLFGTLFPGQSIELNKKESTEVKWNREFLVKSVNQEQAIFISNHSQEVEKAINELRAEIKNLTEVTENIDKEIVQSVSQNVAEFSEYQLNFFQRIKTFIVNFRQNITEAGVWLDGFNHKKSKRYWSKAKAGGQKYQESSEHTVARSAN